MTQQDDWRPEMARLAQRHDQLERQQRETTTRVDALKRDVDRRMDSLRGETDRQFRDGERRVSSLERSRDTFGNLFWYSMPLVAAVAMIIVLVVAVIASREQRREAGEPETRSQSSIDAPLAGSGGPWPPGFVAAGTPFRQHRRSDRINAARATVAGGPGNYFLSTVQSATASPRRTSSLVAIALGWRYARSTRPTVRSLAGSSSWNDMGSVSIRLRPWCWPVVCSVVPSASPAGGSVPPATAYMSPSPYLQEAGEARVDVLGWGIGTAETGACSAAPAG